MSAPDIGRRGRLLFRRLDTVLRHDCIKIHGDAYTLSAAKMYPTVCGFWLYKSYADSRRGSLVRYIRVVK